MIQFYLRLVRGAARSVADLERTLLKYVLDFPGLMLWLFVVLLLTVLSDVLAPITAVWDREALVW